MYTMYVCRLCICAYYIYIYDCICKCFFFVCVCVCSRSALLLWVVSNPCLGPLSDQDADLEG